MKQFCIVILLFAACQANSDHAQGDQTILPDPSKFRNEAATKVTQFQTNLSAILTESISENGLEQSISLCQTQEFTSAMTDTELQVARVTTRARNNDNSLATELDRRAWVYYRENGIEAKHPDTVMAARDGSFYYYKPIFITDEMCLQCHGSRSTGIPLTTLEAIDKLYPADPAVNYRLGDLRALWKVYDQ